MAFKNTFYAAGIAALVLGTFTFGNSPAHAQDNLSKADIEKIVKDYLLENGEIVLEAVDNYRTREEAERQASAAESIKKNIKKLASADAPSAGSDNPDVTVIEFFDYNCGYCKRALPDVQAVLDTDKNVRVVFREMPILGPSSLDAAKWALAAQEQGKYFEYHAALMEHRGEKSPAELKKIGKKLGLDVAKLEKDANSNAIEKKIEKDLELARLVGVDGTPAFIVGEDFYPGYIGEQGLKDAVETARKKSDNEDG